MPYIGNTSPSRFVSNRAASVYSGDGSTTAFTLEQAVVQDEDILVSVDGVIQEPSVAYAVSNGTTLTFTGAPSSDSGNNIFVYYLASQVGTVGHPAAQNLSAGTGTFTGAITGGGVLTTGGNIVIPNAGNIGSASDTDAMAISSGGVVTFSQTPVGNFNAPYWSGRLASNQTIARVTTTTITGFSTNEIDSSSAFDGTTFTVPSGGAGTYFINATIYYDWGASGNDGEEQQTLIVHTPSGGSAATIATGRFNQGDPAKVIYDQTVTATIIFPLGVGDTVIVRAYGADNNGGGGGVALAGQTNFGGFRIGA